MISLRSPHFEFGCQFAAGRDVPRDLRAAREAFRRAAGEGDIRGVHAYAGFLAGGIGGPCDGPGSLALLRRVADRDGVASEQLRLIETMPTGRIDGPRPLHAHKPIALFEALLTPEETGFLIRIATHRLRPATVLAAPDLARTRPTIRDADHAAFNPAEAPPFIHAINARIAAATGTGERQGEPIQIMRYGPGQQYRPHVDGVGGGRNKRQMTAILYLNDDYEGGETAFTELGLKVRGKAGDMLLFHNLREDGELDREMRHAGLPVVSGEKFIASRWILQCPPYDEIGNLIGPTLWS